MVSKNIISKTLNEIIRVKHGFFYQNLGKVKDIVDSDEEYKELKTAIWDWQTRFHDAKEEHLKVKNMLGEEAEMSGDEESCWKTDEMRSIMDNSRLLYTLHNHPNVGCLVSSSDIVCMGDGCEKYSMVLGEDGTMIIKNPYEKFSKEEKENLENVATATDRMLDDFIRKKHKDKFEKAEAKVLDESLSREEIIKTTRELTDFVNKEMGLITKKNGDYFSKKLDKAFKDNDLDCNVFFIPKKEIK